MSNLRRTVSGLAVVALGTATAIALSRPQRRRNYAGRNILITGGSRGLGLELARCWGAEGANIAICSRDGAAVERAVRHLQELGINAIETLCDVRERQDCRDFIDFTRDAYGPIDVLVNNAGVIQVGPLDCMTQEDFENALATHFWGPLSLIGLVLPEMRERRSGQIVNISSIGGRVSVPHLTPYCASKFALVGLSEGLAAELAKDGISVVTVTPGLMRTGSPRNAQFKGQHQAEYAWFSISWSLPGASIDSTSAARRIIDACRRDVRCASVSLTSYLVTACHSMFWGSWVATTEWISQLLPNSIPGTEVKPGWQSPSWLTILNERAAAKNLELAEE